MPNEKSVVLTLEFQDNKHAFTIFGDLNRNLIALEKAMHIRIDQIGNKVELSGTQKSVEIAAELLNNLYHKSSQGQNITSSDFEDGLRLIGDNHKITNLDDKDVTIQTRKNVIRPRTHNQKLYVQALQKHDLVFGAGPAGTGKTYLAVAVAVHYFLSGKVKKIILTRPAVEAGEKLGFLPGDLKEKVDPYLRPLFDALADMLPPDLFNKMMETEQIEIAPLAFMRGRTLSHAFVILDEAQNTTPAQMKMFLTRLGEGSKMAINGDPGQIDLPVKTESGLVQAMDYLGGIPEISMVEFTDADVVRHPLVAQIIRAYNKNGASFSC